MVVCHDASLARFGGGRRPLLAVTRAELARADAGSWFAHRCAGEGLIDLDHLLERYGRRTLLLLELKPSRRVDEALRLVELTIAALRRHRLERQVRILCFDPRILAACAAAAPRLALVLNRTRPPRVLQPLLARLPRLTALDVDQRHLRASLAEECRSAGLALFCWSCNRASQVRRALACGVSGVLTDRPAWLAQLWRRPGASAR